MAIWNEYVIVGAVSPFYIINILSQCEGVSAYLNEQFAVWIRKFKCMKKLFHVDFV